MSYILPVNQYPQLLLFALTLLSCFSLLLHMSQKFSFPGSVPSDLLYYNDSNFNLLASVIQNVVAKQFGTPVNTVIVNRLSIILYFYLFTLTNTYFYF